MTNVMGAWLTRNSRQPVSSPSPSPYVVEVKHRSTYFYPTSEISPNLFEDLSGCNKSSLRSWKRFLRNSNSIKSPEAQNISLLPNKCHPTVDSLIESFAPKKQTIDSDSLNLSHSICGGIPPPLPLT